MSEGNIKRSSHWVGWTLALVAVPVVYVLTLPAISFAIIYDRKAASFRDMPTWLEWYAVPGD